MAKYLKCKYKSVEVTNFEKIANPLIFLIK